MALPWQQPPEFEDINLEGDELLSLTEGGKGGSFLTDHRRLGHLCYECPVFILYGFSYRLDWSRACESVCAPG